MTHSPLGVPSQHARTQHAPTHQPVSPQPPPAHPPRRPRTHRSQPPLAWILSSIALSAIALVPKDLWPRFSMSLSPQPTQQESIQPGLFNRTAAIAPTCQSMLNADQRLSRDQLTQFLSIPQETSRAAIHEAIAPPYCTLSKAHQPKQDEAYPLAFDPDTWFVVNYDGESYQGYDFVFRK
ncbi:hypothetical protein [Leptothoe sp. PORK10 BA2]|uniref:hypothetical protein n=1 Tax=Leptothoe sp. PORK10 BA2 TaxID=3110254 RepID=UPI002B21DA2B|nr:hypothetical protein [Leptothoe sp. PORK10 BA2]MEA5465366.1 hypothetical protein [Leptothoe sp. PORK10 BA2]